MACPYVQPVHGDSGGQVLADSGKVLSVGGKGLFTDPRRFLSSKEVRERVRNRDAVFHLDFSHFSTLLICQIFLKIKRAVRPIKSAKKSKQKTRNPLCFNGLRVSWSE